MRIFSLEKFAILSNALVYFSFSLIIHGFSSIIFSTMSEVANSWKNLDTLSNEKRAI